MLFRLARYVKQVHQAVHLRRLAQYQFILLIIGITLFPAKTALAAVPASFPLSPAFNIMPLSAAHIASTLLELKLQNSLYKGKTLLSVTAKLAALTRARQSGELTTLKTLSENRLNSGILNIYANNYLQSYKEFHALYRTFEKGEYLFYAALNAALLDAGRGRIALSQYQRVAMLQGEGKLWHGAAIMLLTTLTNENIIDKLAYKATIKWFYDQYAFYTCFMMLKLYEQYVPPVRRNEHDWRFIHTMNANLLIQSGNPLDAIDYLVQNDETHHNLTHTLLNKLGILYYKTQHYQEALATFARIPEAAELGAAHIYYRALLALSQDDQQTFSKLHRTLSTQDGKQSTKTFIAKLAELNRLSEQASTASSGQLSLRYPPSSQPSASSPQ